MDGFSYAGNDPINYIDPSGHFGHIVGGAFVGGMIGGEISIVGSVMQHGWNMSEMAVSFASGFAGGAVAGGTIAATGGLACLGSGVAHMVGMGALGSVSSVVGTGTDLMLHEKSLTSDVSSMRLALSAGIGFAGGAALGTYASRLGVTSQMEGFMSRGLGLTQEFAGRTSGSMMDNFERSYDQIMNGSQREDFYSFGKYGPSTRTGN
jgi:hypothetical protein